jgi:transcriptional antiterminator RfaH
VMFPRYAFVRPSHAGLSIAPVRSTPGVSSLVSFGHILATMADGRLHALRAVVDQRLRHKPDEAAFPAGTAVVFAEGPLKGQSGLVSGVARDRVMVMLSLLGRDQVVRVPAAQLVHAEVATTA